MKNNDATPYWMLDDEMLQVHHHSGVDDRDFIVDDSDGTEVSPREASERALKNLHEKHGFNATRRGVLGGTLGVAVALVSESALPRYAFAADGVSPNGTLVVVFLRGGVDGLNVLSPYNDPRLTALRSTTFSNPALGGLDINGQWSLHKSMAPLRTAWNNGHLSFAHGVGTPGMGRSHFVEQDRIERSAPMGVSNGWLGRYIMATASSEDRLFRMVSSRDTRIASTRTPSPILSAADFNTYRLDNNPNNSWGRALKEMHAGDKRMSQEVDAMLASISEVASVTKTPYTPANSAQYTTHPFGRSLRQIAQTIKMKKGLEVAAVDMSGWDTHVNQAAAMELLLNEFSKNLAAFYQDMGSEMENVTVVCQSEFGRTTVENASKGCDHGKGNLLMTLSGKANPRSVVGSWSGLGKDVTDAQGDVQVLNDHRDFMSEILRKNLNATPSVLSSVFPEHTIKTTNILR